jgi:hypothetical protein
MTPMCDCSACRDLLTECGDELFAFYSRRLLVRGWAGSMSAAERAYVRRHRSAAQQQAAEAARRRALECRTKPPLTGLQTRKNA